VFTRASKCPFTSVPLPSIHALVVPRKVCDMQQFRSIFLFVKKYVRVLVWSPLCKANTLPNPNWFLLVGLLVFVSV
jgi:hypothetical protein